MNRLKQHWRNLRSRFWFMPSLIVVVSIVVAVALIEADSTGIDRWLARWPRLFGAGADGARGMMSTIASSMMTVVGVTFSMILVVLTLASSQYTSRILRNFTRSRVTQVVLGIFAGVFTYCLIVLRTIRGGDEVHLFPAWRCSSASCWRWEELWPSCSSFTTSPLRSRPPASSPRSLRKPSPPLTGCFRKNLEKGQAKTRMTKRDAL